MWPLIDKWYQWKEIFQHCISLCQHWCSFLNPPSAVKVFSCFLNNVTNFTSLVKLCIHDWTVSNNNKVEIILFKVTRFGINSGNISLSKWKCTYSSNKKLSKLSSRTYFPLCSPMWFRGSANPWYNSVISVTPFCCLKLFFLHLLGKYNNKMHEKWHAHIALLQRDHSWRHCQLFLFLFSSVSVNFPLLTLGGRTRGK